MNPAPGNVHPPLWLRPVAAVIAILLASCAERSPSSAPEPASSEGPGGASLASPLEEPDPEAREQASALVQTAWRDLRSGRLEEAAAGCRRALELDPGFGRAHYMLGRALLYLSDIVVGSRTRDARVLAEALVALERASELMPESAEVHQAYGQALALSGREQEGIAEYEEAIALDPESGLAVKELALLHVRMGDGERAKELLLHAAELLPEDPSIHFLYGQELELDGDIEGAREAYERSIAIDWTIPGPHSKLAVVYEILGEHEAAAAEARAHERWTSYGKRLKAALAAVEGEGRKDAGATLALAALFREALRSDSALVWLKLSLRSNGPAPERLAARLLACAVEREAEHAEKGREHLRQAAAILAAAPGPDEAHDLLAAFDRHVLATDHAARLAAADALLEAGRVLQARERYASLLEDAPGLSAAREGLARSQAEGGPR